MTRDPGWNGRGHFLAAAAEAMRRVLINRARDRGRLKRGGDRYRVDLENLRDPFEAPDEDLFDLDEALDRLAGAYPRPAELVKLRFFAGLSLAEAAATLGISIRTADREWMFARAWLRDALGPA
jgi:RNA polymerase sigma factor (TIGR02999 family)